MPFFGAGSSILRLFPLGIRAMNAESESAFSTRFTSLFVVAAGVHPAVWALSLLAPSSLVAPVQATSARKRRLSVGAE